MGIGKLTHHADHVDLNRRARIALGGLSSTPTKDIVALLRSDQFIEPQTRTLLANALEGKSKTIGLDWKNKSYAKEARRFLSLRKRLNEGRNVASKISSLGYVGAISEGSVRFGRGTKTIESNVTLANEVDAWVSKKCEADCIEYHLDAAALELVYLYAIATNQTPSDCLRQSASAFPILIDYFDRYAEKSN